MHQRANLVSGNGWSERDPDAPVWLLLVRPAPELTTKSRGTQRRFQRRLLENMADALTATGAPFQARSQWSRLFVRTTALGLASEALARVPGIDSLSVIETTAPAELDRIVEAGRAAFHDRVQGHTYAVRARRVGEHPFSSGDVQRQLGAALNPGARVDLSDPEVEVSVEVRDEKAYLFSGRTPGFGGLPLGVEGRALCLLSGGFDSAVAAWLMLKRGVELDYLFCNLAGQTNERAVVEVARVLADQWSYGSRPRLHVIDFTAPVQALREATHPRFWQLVLKRQMYRAASHVARELRAHALITGEAIGQVSSQTLANLRAIEPASTLPVFRPLIGFDKKEIIERTRSIGTHDLSARVKEYCAIAPGNPVTSATPAQARREEEKIDPAVLRSAVRDRHALDLRDLDATDLVRRYLFTDRIDPGATVIDLRPEPQWRNWHYPGSRQADRTEMLGELGSLDAERSYVIFCEQGMQSAHLAEQMRERGLDAVAFRGGMNALKRSARAAEGGAEPAGG